jgi:hypothetical protein
MIENSKRIIILLDKMSFSVPESYSNCRFVLHFEDMKMQSKIIFNGFTAARRFPSTAPFSVDVSDYMRFDGENTLSIVTNGVGEIPARETPADSSQTPADGLCRPITLEIMHRSCFTEEPHITVTKSSRGDWNIAVTGKITGIDGAVEVKKTVFDPYDSPISTFVTDTAVIHDPEIWDVNNPVLYTLKTELIVNGTPTDEYICRFGFRTIEMQGDKGFYLNGRPLKIFAIYDRPNVNDPFCVNSESLAIYKISRMKEMGANAVIAVGGMASDAPVKACDRLGMLLCDSFENFDTSRETVDDIHAMVTRDYNHPCVAFYTLPGSPSYTEDNQIAAKIAAHLYDECHAADKTRIITSPCNTENDIKRIPAFTGISESVLSYDEYHSFTDNCGFAKGGYYLSKAAFASSPYVRFFPDYDGEPDEPITLTAATNCPVSELFINGESQGKKSAENAVWEFPFTPGVAVIIGYSQIGEKLCEFSEKSPEAFADIKLNPFFDAFDDKTDLIPVTLTAVDAVGCFCPRQAAAVNITVEGGSLKAFSNGDSNSPPNGVENALRGGKALTIVAADNDAVFIKIIATFNINGEQKTSSVTIPNKKHKTVLPV